MFKIEVVARSIVLLIACTDGQARLAIESTMRVYIGDLKSDLKSCIILSTTLSGLDDSTGSATT